MTRDDVFFLVVGGLGVLLMSWIAWRAYGFARAVRTQQGRFPRRTVFFWCLWLGVIVLYAVGAVPLLIR